MSLFGVLPEPESSRDETWFRKWLAQQTISFQRVVDGTLQSGVVLQSSDYSAGSAGWQIDGDGNAEFNDVTIRGTLTTGAGAGTNDPYIGIGDGSGISYINFYSDDTDEYTPSYIQSYSVGTGTAKRLGIRISGGKWDVSDEEPYILLRSALKSGSISDIQLGINVAGGPSITIGGSTTSDLIIFTAAGTQALYQDGQWQSTASLTSTPVYSFAIDEAAGMGYNTHPYLATTGQFRVFVDDYEVGAWGGSPAANYDSNGWFKVSDGTAALPGVMFGNDTDTGFYRYAANRPALSTGNATHTNYYISGNERRIEFGLLTNDWLAYDISLDQWKLYIGGTAELILGASGFEVENVYNATTATAANVNVASGGSIRRSTSSGVFKQDVKTFVDHRVIDGLRPVTFRSKLEADDRRRKYVGFIAEEVAEAFPAARMDDNYDVRAIVAALVAKVQYLEERIAA